MSKDRNVKNDDDVARVMELFGKYGSIEYAREYAHELAKNAKHGFEGLSFPGPPDAVEDLMVLIDYMVDRDS